MSMLASAARGIKNLWDKGDDDYEDDEILEAEESQPTSKPAANKYSSDKYSSDKYSPEKYAPEKYAPSYGGGEGSQSRARALRSVPIPLRSRDKNIYTLRPKNIDEAAIAADYLKSGSAVVMNLETLNQGAAVRIMDFMSGVCYGLEGQGHAMKLGNAIFLFTPGEFEISSDELDYGENRDFFFKDVEGTLPAPQANAPQAMQAKTQAAPAPARSTPGAVNVAGSTPGAPPASPSSGNVSPSGYATADYTPPMSISRDTTGEIAPGNDASISPSPPSRPPVSQISNAPASTLPASSVYGSSGKAHVLINGKPAAMNASPTNSSPAPQSSYQSSERRSWER